MLKRKKKLSIYVVLFPFLLLNTINAQNLQFSGDVAGVSTYIWRGIKQFDGVALQGSVNLLYKSLTFGLWYSSVNFGEDTPFMEIDPYIAINLPTGPITSSIGATFYTYDFSEFNDDADFEYEIFTKLNYSLFRLVAYYIPEQSSTENYIKNSFYWLELSTGLSLLNLDWQFMFEYGSYSSRFLSTPKKDAVGSIVVSITEDISKQVGITWNYSLATSSALDNNLWISVVLTY